MNFTRWNRLMRQFGIPENLVPKVIRDRVRHLILATAHSVELIASDDKLIVDIDLAILGCSEPNYSIFERNVRKEYRWVPSVIPKLLGTAGFQREFKGSNARHLLQVMATPLSSGLGIYIKA